MSKVISQNFFLSWDHKLWREKWKDTLSVNRIVQLKELLLSDSSKLMLCDDKKWQVELVLWIGKGKGGRKRGWYMPTPNFGIPSYLNFAVPTSKLWKGKLQNYWRIFDMLHCHWMGIESLPILYWIQKLSQYLWFSHTGTSIWNWT